MGPGIAQLYLDHIYWWFGLPLKVISDHDMQFTSHFSRALVSKLGVEQNLSSAYHPQTDGLSERKNQWIEQYLRLLTTHQQNKWTHWLPIASAVHNNHLNSTLGTMPNEALLGYCPILYPNQVIPSNNEAAETRMQTMFQKCAQAMAAINQATKPHIVIPDQFQTGQMVWLEGTNLKLPYQSIKLASKCQGPFKIIKTISPVAFRLELPPTWTIHDVFHASLLTSHVETSAHSPNFI